MQPRFLAQIAAGRDHQLHIPQSDSGQLPLSILVRRHPVLGNAPICGACCALLDLILAKLLQGWIPRSPSTERDSNQGALND